MTAPTLALLATMTLPAFHADTTGTLNRSGYQACDPGTAPLLDLAFVRVIVERQSPTWLAHEAAFKACDGPTWYLYGDKVFAEATPVMVTRTPIDPKLAGTVYTFTPYNPWNAHPLFVRVETETSSGRVSCPSNWTQVP